MSVYEIIVLTAVIAAIFGVAVILKKKAGKDGFFSKDTQDRKREK